MQPSCILVGLGNTLSSRWAGDSPVSQPRLRGVRYTSPGVSFSFIIETVLRWEVLLYLCTKILLYLFCLLLRTYFDRPHWENPRYRNRPSASCQKATGRKREGNPNPAKQQKFIGSFRSRRSRVRVRVSLEGAERSNLSWVIDLKI